MSGATTVRLGVALLGYHASQAQWAAQIFVPIEGDQPPTVLHLAPGSCRHGPGCTLSFWLVGWPRG